MTEKKNKLSIFKKPYFLVAGVVILLSLIVVLLYLNYSDKGQAMGASGVDIYFDGEYRIGDGEWHKIEKGEHIPASEGDVTLRGFFKMANPESGEYIGVAPKGMPIAFFLDHVSVTVNSGGERPYAFSHEHPSVGDAACGEAWFPYSLQSDGSTPIEIVIHNPHSFGNETAIDSLISGIALWTGTDFEGEVLSNGATQRYMGIFFCIGALVLLGIALFSTLLHVKKSRIIWLFGFWALFAGAYLAYSADGTYFWSEKIAANTTVIGASMMCYMLFASAIITFFLNKVKKLGIAITAVQGVAVATFLVLPIVSDIYFYDMLMAWVIVQSVANLLLIACLITEFVSSDKKYRFAYLCMTLLFVAFEVDLVINLLGYWKGGVVSMCVFVVLFMTALFVVLRIIPKNINAALKAKELEREKMVLNAQLAETRISTMMSQIRPHFIYNTLGSIEQLCELDPPKAGALVHDFAKYLRGNFGELDNPKPISMTQEMEHVHHYVSIENVRFPDMTFTFEMNSEDFKIPALTIQPIVENAIKHGLMKLQKGGIIRVVSYETETHYCVKVEDDGVGFDTSVLLDERQHVGLRNIRERLAAMVNGTLEIESTVGVGTTVLIKIPKEAEK